MRPGAARAPTRDRDPFEVEGGHELRTEPARERDVRYVRRAGPSPVHLSSGGKLDERALESITELLHGRIAEGAIASVVGSNGETGCRDGVDRSGADPPLLRAAEENRLDTDARPGDEGADPFWSANLVGGHAASGGPLPCLGDAAEGLDGIDMQRNPMTRSFEDRAERLNDACFVVYGLHRDEAHVGSLEGTVEIIEVDRPAWRDTQPVNGRPTFARERLGDPGDGGVLEPAGDQDPARREERRSERQVVRLGAA